MLSTTRSVVILSSFSAAAWAAEQRLRGSNGTHTLTSSGPCCSFDGCQTCSDWCTQQGKDVCLAPQGAPGGGCDNSGSDPNAAPPQWCEAGAGKLTAAAPADLASPDCSEFCCWSPVVGDCGSCGDDWNNRMYARGCNVPCSGPGCAANGGHFNEKDDYKSSCPKPMCQAGLGSPANDAPAAPSASKQAGNVTAEPLTSSGPCCSFDGCKTCADWCTQQGKDVCLAPQGAPGGGCDNSGSDPNAAPPQWCEAGAGQLSANDAPKLAASTVTCSAEAAKACADSNLFCIYDKAGCQADGAQCGIQGESKSEDQYNCRYCNQPKPTGGSITDGADCQLPSAVLAEPVSGSNGTHALTSSGPCCSFDGCKTCADWCTQQGKDVCLAPQGAPGGGCDNSGSDPNAAPPQWCEAGQLSANDAPKLAASTVTSGDKCSQFCCWSGSDCGSCGDDWNNRMYEEGCQVPCTGANCGSGQAHQYFNTQAGALEYCSSPGFKCY